MTDGPIISDPDDDAYSALFRPEPEPVVVLGDPQPVQQPAPVLAAEPAFISPNADTGRLFRSQGADASSHALAAVPANQVSELRTMNNQSALIQPVSTTDPGSEQVFAAPIQATSTPEANLKESQEMAKSRRVDSGLNPMGVYIVVIGVGLVAGFLDSFITGSGLGWLTGIALLAACVFCALKVRISDASVAVIAPPLAYGIAAVTVGQLGQSRAGGAFISAVVNGFFTLADNWFWVISTTLIALAIVVVRARR